jgi:hypothetical protein
LGFDGRPVREIVTRQSFVSFCKSEWNGRRDALSLGLSVSRFQRQFVFCHVNIEILRNISGFRRGVNEICVRLGFYAAYIGSLSQTFRDNPSVPSFKGAAVQVSLLSPRIPHRLPSKSNPNFRGQKTLGCIFYYK